MDHTKQQGYYRPGYLYFSFFVWISTTGGRYLAPFLENEGGLSSEAIGLTLAMQSVISMALSSLGGSWADTRERSRPGKGRVEVMAMGILMGGLCCLLHALHRFVTWEVFASHVWHSGLQFFYAGFSVLTISILDGTTIQFLEDHPDFTKEDYGRERFWGAVAWAIVHMIMSIFLDWAGFVIIYPFAFLSTLLALFTLYQYAYRNGPPSGTVLKKRASDIVDIRPSKDAPKIPLHVICRMLVGTLYGCTFFMAILTLAQGQAVVDSLVFLFFEYLGSSYTIMGLTVLLTVSFEIPIFRMAPSLLERYGSGVLLLVGCLCYIVRAVGYSCIPKGRIMYVLAVEPLHGITYGCVQTASVDVAAKSSPKGYEASGQSLMSMVRGFGSCLGLWLGGRAMDHLGPRLMYRVSACVCLFGSCFFAVVMLMHPPPEQDRHVVPTDDPEEMLEDPLECEDSEIEMLAAEVSEPNDTNSDAAIEVQRNQTTR